MILAALHDLSVEELDDACDISIPSGQCSHYGDGRLHGTEVIDRASGEERHARRSDDDYNQKTSYRDRRQFAAVDDALNREPADKCSLHYPVGPNVV